MGLTQQPSNKSSKPPKQDSSEKMTEAESEADKNERIESKRQSPKSYGETKKHGRRLLENKPENKSKKQGQPQVATLVDSKEGDRASAGWGSRRRRSCGWPRGWRWTNHYSNSRGWRRRLLCHYNCGRRGTCQWRNVSQRCRRVRTPYRAWTTQCQNRRQAYRTRGKRNYRVRTAHRSRWCRLVRRL